MSLIERASERLAQRDRPALLDPAGVAAHQLVLAEPVGGRHLPGDREQRPGGAAARRSREITLNYADLARNCFVTPNNRRSRLFEELRLLKRRLLKRLNWEITAAPEPRSVRQPNVVLVTSARMGEGKSYFTLNLALSLVIDEGINVLLVDGDVLRPKILATLGLPDSRGLTDRLRDGSIDLADLFLRVEGLPLTIFPAGTEVASATELFGGRPMSELVTELSTRYPDRLIIFDSPPLLATTEPVALAQHVDQIVLLVRAGRTTNASIEAALDLLDGRENVCLVLNGCKTSGQNEDFGADYKRYL